MKPILEQSKTIYLQIAETIEDDILKGVIQEEEQVPSTNQFAKLLQINPATAAKGINLLVDEGILYKKRGIGMFVNSGARTQVLKKRQEHFMRDVLPRMLEEARKLQITREDLIHMIENSTERSGSDDCH